MELQGICKEACIWGSALACPARCLAHLIQDVVHRQPLPIMLELTPPTRAQRNVQRGLRAVGADHTAQVVSILRCVKGCEEAPVVQTC